MSSPRAGSDIDDLVRREIGELRALIKAIRMRAALDKLDAIEAKLRTLSKDLKGAD